ncbi:MAG: hypothetical protein MUO53_12935 [Maribacter sp.]|nr:hypothetical protein [Maribacter sp.]
MKKLFLMLAFPLAVACSHDLDDTTCATNDPANDLEWLKEEIAAIASDTSDFAKYRLIEQATFKGATVFVISNCCPNCNTVVDVFDCRGKLLGQLYAEIPFEKIRDSKLLFKRDDSPCK